MACDRNFSLAEHVQKHVQKGKVLKQPMTLFLASCYIECFALLCMHRDIAVNQALSSLKTYHSALRLSADFYQAVWLPTGQQLDCQLDNCHRQHSAQNKQNGFSVKFWCLSQWSTIMDWLLPCLQYALFGSAELSCSKSVNIRLAASQNCGHSGQMTDQSA